MACISSPAATQWVNHCPYLPLQTEKERPKSVTCLLWTLCSSLQNTGETWQAREVTTTVLSGAKCWEVTILHHGHQPLYLRTCTSICACCSQALAVRRLTGKGGSELVLGEILVARLEMPLLLFYPRSNVGGKR